MASSEFEELQHQACQLTADIEMSSELPRVEKSLYQLRDMALKMASKAPADASYMKASLLLGSRGYDISKTSEKLESLNRLNTFEPLEPIQDADVEAYLRNEYENILLAAVEITRKKTLEESSSFSWGCREKEWEKQKQKIFSSLSDYSTNASAAPSDKSLNDTIMYSTNHSRLSTTSSNHQVYDDVICRHNTLVMEGHMKESLVSLFKQVANKFDDQPALEMWSLLGYLVEVHQRDSVTQLLNHSLIFLEKSYLTFIERMVSSNLQEARLGGVPGRYNMIISYFNTRHNTPFRGAEDGLLEGHPVWVVLYQCLRCGSSDAIDRAVKDSRRLVGDIADILQEYKDSPNRTLPAASQREVKQRYRRTVYNSADPYKRLIYCILGKCDPQDDHPEVATTTDDYLWLKLSMVEEEEEEEGGGGSSGGAGGRRSLNRSRNKSFDVDSCNSDKLSLHRLQSLMIENYGESHFNAHQQPLLYTKILLLIGQFERAVEFLFRFDPHQHLAVHIACTLHAHNLLHTPQNYNTHLLSTDPSDPPLTQRLNLVHLITTFNSHFESNDAFKALHYYYLLRTIRTSDNQTDLFTHSLCQLVISTKDYDLILGQMQADGTRKPGLVDRFKVDAVKVIEKVAGEVEDGGHMVDAVRLYDLAKNQTKVVTLLTQLLSQVVTLPPKPQSDNLKKMAMQFANRSSYQLTTSPTLTTFHLFLDLCTFFQFYHVGNFQEAYNIIQELNLVSLSPLTLEVMIKRTHGISMELRRCMPELLLATAHCISQLYKQLLLRNDVSISAGDEASRKELMKEYRTQMASLVSFSGSMTSRMPSHVTAQLVSLEASIK